MKKKIIRLTLIIVMLAVAQGMMAQPDRVTIKFSGNVPNIKDFVTSYAAVADGETLLNTFAREVRKGSHKIKNTETVVDTKNGFASYDELSEDYGPMERYEMCYWNCANKQEKIVAINRLSLFGDVPDESYVVFYRYNNSTHVMTRIDAPFSRLIRPIDWTKPGRTSQKNIEYARTVGSEDANGWAPVYSLPRIGRNINVTIADGMVLPLAERQNYVYEWNGNGFTLKKTD